MLRFGLRAWWQRRRWWWIFAVLSPVGCTIGYTCHKEAREAPPVDARPWYLQDVCRRVLCDSPTRLPDDATRIGRCN